MSSYRLFLPLALAMIGGLTTDVQSQSQPPMLLESPTVSRSQVAFEYAGDIWIVDRQGGDARRLTTHAARETYPVFSPDGSHVAFARFNAANGPFGWDVYVVPVAGGEERRLTYHPDLDLPINWTPDGKNVLILSFRQRTSLFDGHLYTVPVEGGFPTDLPVPRGWAGSFSGSGDRIAYTPTGKTSDVLGWRNYRGGGTSRIWLATLSDSSVETIPRSNSNDTDPMWVGDKVYFVSDRNGTENLFSYDTTTKAVVQLTRFEKYGIKAASANAGAIVFAQGGTLYLLDLKTNQTSKLGIKIAGDFPEVQPRKIDTAQWLNSIGLSPDATQLLLGIRGEIFKANTVNGEIENLTQTGAAAERGPVWSPDGKWIAYFSDESGEQQLFLRTAQGDSIRRINVELKPSFYSELQWSPDSTKLAFSDAHRGLWYFNLADNTPRRVDAAQHTDGDPSLQPAWSPDGRWLAYSKFGFNRLRSITLYSLDSGKVSTLTGPQLDAQSPLFDNNGKYLYFIGSNRTGLVESQGMSGFPFRTQVTRNLYVIVLSTSESSPLVQSNEAVATRGDRVSVDLDNIGQRTVPVPFWPPNANRIIAGRAGVLFIVEGGTLHRFVAGKSGLEQFVEGGGNYRINGDGSRLLFRRQGNWAIVSTDTPPKAEEGRFKLNPIDLTIDPRAEWRQMYGEAWRSMREYFYDPNLHGLDLAETRAHYAAYLPSIVTREELNQLFKEMFSHLSTSHMGTSGGDVSVPHGAVQEDVGLLGADFEIVNRHYRIKRILRGDSIRGITSPLAQPGLNIKAGEYLLAIDDEEIKAEENLYRYFLNKASKTVKLKVGPQPDGEGARTISVRPIASEYQLRQYDWAEGNRLRVAELSAGKLAYVFLPDTGDAGYNAFNRDFYAQLDKQGILVDGRFNQGGRAADYIIDTLRRVPLQHARLRDAEDIRIPTGIIEGPKVLLTNEMAGSGGDSLPWMWQQAKLGPVVGFRTAGAGIGASAHILIDGGSFQVPDWGWYDPRNGTWFIENRGITPEYQLEIMPADWRAGRDPQLEKAVQLALEALRRTPPPVTKRPKFPVYK
jgi:tricorn protease